jgi:predicted DNA-binding transcriptional regulator YafY
VLGTSARLLRLLTLLQSRASWAGPELAERLDVTPRTLRRDVGRLRSLGYPVEGATGVAGGYVLGPGASLPPLSLDEDEATAVFVGLHAAAGTGVTGAGTSAMRALAKLERVLPIRLRKNLRTLHSSVLELGDRPRHLSLANVSDLAGACSERLATRIRYTTHGGATTDRRVEPFRLVRVGALWYLVAWDPSKDEWRTFRLDRIASVERQSERFKARPPPGDDLAEYVTKSLSSALYPHRATVLLDAPLEEVRRRIGPRDGLFVRASNNTCTMELGAPTLDVLAARILWLGVDFEVLTPDALRRHLRTVIARLERASRPAIAKEEPPVRAKAPATGRPGSDIGFAFDAHLATLVGVQPGTRYRRSGSPTTAPRRRSTACAREDRVPPRRRRP